MKEDDPVKKRENAHGAQQDSGREDTNPGNSDALARFGKDKRKRITRVEKAPGRYEAREPGGYSGERRSYNPNFTPDNKLKGNPDYNRKPRTYGDSSQDDRFNSTRYRENNRERDPRDNRSYGSGYQRSDSRSEGVRGTYRPDDRRDSSGGYNKSKPYGNKDNSRYGGGGKRPPGNASSPGGKFGGPGNSKFGKKPGGRPQPKYNQENYPKYPRERQEAEIRLNRFLSMSGICSRREADELISEGKVTVNGNVITEMGAKVQPSDVVCYNGKEIKGENKVYIVMNKPKGFVTSLDDPHAEKTVMDILKNAVKERVYPVGRLDKNSMGVLLITNDGDMTKKLTHPSYEKKKVYQVTLDKALAPADRVAIAEGITLEDGFIRADNIDYVSDDPKQVGIEIHSGRNRVVRRIFEYFGYQVYKLDRVYFAGLTKKNLKRGAWRFLTPREVAALHSGQYE